MILHLSHLQQSSGNKNEQRRTFSKKCSSFILTDHYVGGTIRL